MSNPAGLTKLEYFALSTQHPPSKPPPSTQLSRTTWSASMKPDREAEYQRGYDAGWAACAETFKMNGLNLDAMARLDKATELLRAALGRSECYDEDHECGETDTTRAIRAFLSERKTNDKQS